MSKVLKEFVNIAITRPNCMLFGVVIGAMFYRWMGACPDVF